MTQVVSSQVSPRWKGCRPHLRPRREIQELWVNQWGITKHLKNEYQRNLEYVGLKLMFGYIYIYVYVIYSKSKFLELIQPQKRQSQWFTFHFFGDWLSKVLGYILNHIVRKPRMILECKNWPNRCPFPPTCSTCQSCGLIKPTIKWPRKLSELFSSHLLLGGQFWGSWMPSIKVRVSCLFCSSQNNTNNTRPSFWRYEVCRASCQSSLKAARGEHYISKLVNPREMDLEE